MQKIKIINLLVNDTWIYFLDSAAYYQFAKYFEEKGVIPDIKDTNQTEAFIHDFYPGMKDMPNRFVELMASPDPEKTLNIKANLKLEGDEAVDNLQNKQNPGNHHCCTPFE